MLKYLVILLFGLSCKAQTPIKSLFNDERDEISGAYYKDIDNDFDPYVGTWRYQTSTVNWEITFIKKTMYHQITSISPYYVDRLIGVYKYTKNGVVLVNTLSQLSDPPQGIYDYKVYSMGIMGKDAIPVCTECTTNERRIALYFEDPSRNIEGLSGMLVLRHVIENGVHKIKARLWQTGAAGTNNGVEPAFHDFTMPFGDYTFVKVN